MNTNDHLRIETEGQVSPLQRRTKLADSIYSRAIQLQAMAREASNSAQRAKQAAESACERLDQVEMELRELCADAAFLTSELRAR
jgi:hypothetical protein